MKFMKLIIFYLNEIYSMFSSVQFKMFLLLVLILLRHIMDKHWFIVAMYMFIRVHLTQVLYNKH